MNAYMPPVHQKSEIKAQWGELEGYVADIILQNPNAMVVLGGILNARLRPNDQTLYTWFGHTPPDLEVEGPLTTRASKD